ncbi:Carboxypeptidase A1 precursor [Alloactinosynnema sp. L-07]|uniref:M14 family metallopeptidase n=1 Tax=Alloactinosynnema sp. L-07 TaxID=1653480 RepID=UPI00065F052E|nr:M14 family metallopeptidase [Alloactinosynnema sp. L-07]CRK58257.1 Carboxypeptidase A1 precursor [Alloactinosynnema sp. L-07]
MKRTAVILSTLALVFSGVVMPPAQAAPTSESLEVYNVLTSPETAGELARDGLDVVAARTVGDQVEVEVVLADSERDRLVGRGLDVKVKRTKDGKSTRQLAAEQAANGFTVWRSYDEPGGIRDQIYALARANRNLVKLEVLGHTGQGREIIAVKVTQGAPGIADGSRPAVLYSSTQHAREWISTEVNRRLLNHYVDRFKANDPEIKRLLKDTELWFILVANPDGYQYSFDAERLWRKNLRDNDNNGVTTVGDGVDPNRNFNEHWNYDAEGSSSATSSETYRGANAASEPETRAMAGLLDRIKPKFQSNWHSAGEWILYPQGWQTGTPEADNPIYVALAGTDANPAIAGFDPGISSDELYVTNGETTDYADTSAGTVAFTPELSEGCEGCGFVFPDDPALVEAQFQRTLPFALSLARSAPDPANPKSAVGITAAPFYLDQADIDPENGPLSMMDFTFDVSYGDPQQVRVLAKKSLGAVTAKWEIDGVTHSAPTTEWTGGERYGVGNANYYHVVSGEVTGTSPGDKVKVWFEGGGATSPSFEYQAVAETGDRVLVLAAEDYTGASPPMPGVTSPQFLSYYTDALTASGISHDVYDVDANGRVAPDALGVLSHYDAVVWYTGNDVITRELGWGPGNASSLAQTELFEIRDYLNEGGKVLYTGKFAGHQYATGHGTMLYDPFENAQCRADPAIQARCRPLSGAGDNINDVIEYWFGASTINEDAGTDPDTGDPFDVKGVSDPYTGLALSLNGADSAQNQNHTASFLTTSGLLPVGQYPQFASTVAAGWDRPGGPFAPHTGDFYVYSQIGDISYKRLTRTLAVPAGGAQLSFWTSYDTEPAWDHLFVEARTAGGDNWTTLPDLNGHTTADPGESCLAGWRDLHPHLDRYQTLNPDGTCSPTGAGGVWNSSSGSSHGWQQWNVDLAAYAGQSVEISIAYASDWSIQGLGAFIDDIVMTTGEGTTSFETGLDGWAATGPAAGSAPNPNNFIRATAAGFPEGAVVATADTLYFGFGFEGISGAAVRNEVMDRAIEYLIN